jgi:hypothetical protein
MASKPAIQYSVCKVSKATPTVRFLEAVLFEELVGALSQPAKIRTASKAVQEKKSFFIL